MADGGGLSPQTSYEEVLPVFKTGHRYAVLHHPFKVVLPAEIAPAASSFRKLMLCLLSYGRIK